MKNIMSYKDYTGTVEFNEKERVFTGKVIGADVKINYAGACANDLINDFHTKVDNYLKLCTKNQVEPEHSFKGSFNVRISPYMHKKAAEYALDHDISLNTLVNQAIRCFLQNNKDSEQ